jgi:hypothetical protein
MRSAFLIMVLAAAVTAVHGRAADAQSKDGENRLIVVINERSSEMVRLYASRTTTSDWEENILSQPIPAGASVRINFDDGTGACHFDFRAVFRDNQSVHMWNINVCVESYWRTTD